VQNEGSPKAETRPRNVVWCPPQRKALGMARRRLAADGSVTFVGGELTSRPSARAAVLGTALTTMESLGRRLLRA